MDFKNGVKDIQAAAYNGMHTVRVMIIIARETGPEMRIFVRYISLLLKDLAESVV